MFNNDKKTFLQKIDKSVEGKIDEHIINLVNTINKQQNYYTTSSCSGRITIAAEDPSKKKTLYTWILKSHEPITLEHLKQSLQNLPDKDIWFRQESMILHVACRTIEDANSLLQLTANVGLKRSGITSISKKIIVEIMSSEKIETIIAKDGKVLIDDIYLQTLIDEANKKLLRNHHRIKQFNELMQSC